MESTIGYSSERMAEVNGLDSLDINQSLGRLLWNCVEKRPHDIAVVSTWQVAGDTHVKWSYESLSSMATSLANVLQILDQRGSHVFAVLGNSAEWALVLWSAAKTGRTFICVDPRTRPDDMCYFLQLIQPTVLIVQSDETAENLDNLQPSANCIKLTCSPTSRNGWQCLYDPMKEHEDVQCTHEASSPDDIALVVFTSGTTARPKGCLHTGRNLCSQTILGDETPGLRDVICMPVSHMISVNCALRTWRAGGSIILPSEYFDPSAVLRVVETEKCNRLSTVPSVIPALLQSPAFKVNPSHRLDYVYLTGERVSEDTLHLCQDGGLKARHAYEGYGASEFGPGAACRSGDQLLQNRYYPGCGKVVNCGKLRICAPGGRKPLKRNEIGELHIGGSNVIDGYWGIESDRIYEHDGTKWFASGDLAKIDENDVLQVIGRQDMMIIRAGQNISPLSLEDTLKDIKIEWVVVGMPDSVAGEVPVGIVSLSKSEIMRKMAGLGQALGQIITADDLGIPGIPLSLTGKPQRATLKTLVKEYQRTSVLKAQSSSPISPDRLLDIWTDVLGFQVDIHRAIYDFTDSVTILRFCNKVSNLGLSLYLEDFKCRETSTKDILMILGERHDPNLTQLTSTPSVDENILMQVNRLVHDEPFALEDVESIIPIKPAFDMFLSGSRPHSYRHKIAFDVRKTGIDTVYAAAEALLLRHPILRSFALQLEDGSYHAILKGTSHICDRFIEREEVQDASAVQTRLNELPLQRASKHQMYEVLIILSRDTNRVTVSFSYNHSIFDALSSIGWYHELDQLLEKGPKTLKTFTPFKVFAEMLQENRANEKANSAIEFYTHHLQGISRFKESLWPHQRAPGWMIHSDQGCSDYEDREASRKELGTVGVTARLLRPFHAPFLREIRSRYGIQVSTVMLSAISILNVHVTKQSHAIFSIMDSGRTWPFISHGVKDYLPPASTIDGPTLELVPQVTEILGEETVLHFFERIARIQDDIAKHCHAYQSAIHGNLGEEDALIASDALRRQIFNWDVSCGYGFRPNAFRNIRSNGRWDYPDCGVFWNCGPGLTALESITVIMVWDSAQLSKREADEIFEKVLRILTWITEDRHLDCTIAELQKVLTGL